MVFAKSYTAQLARSRTEARCGGGPGIIETVPPDAARASAAKDSAMATPVRVDALNWRSKLPPMLPPRLSLVRALRRTIGPLSAGLLIIACKQDAPAVRVNTKAVTGSTHVDSAVTAPPSNGWNPVAGPVLLVAGASPDEAIVFFGPSAGTAASVDTGSVDEATATLFGRD